MTELGRFDELNYKVVVDFSHVTCLQDDAAKKAQALNYTTQAVTQLYDDGHITRNQLLNELGQEPISGGDDYISEEERFYNTNRQAPGSNPIAGTSIDPEVDPEVGDEQEDEAAEDKPKSKRVPPVLFNKNRIRKKIKFFNNVRAK